MFCKFVAPKMVNVPLPERSRRSRGRLAFCDGNRPTYIGRRKRPYLFAPQAGSKARWCPRSDGARKSAGRRTASRPPRTSGPGICRDPGRHAHLAQRRVRLPCPRRLESARRNQSGHHRPGGATQRLRDPDLHRPFRPEPDARGNRRCRPHVPRPAFPRRQQRHTRDLRLLRGYQPMDRVRTTPRGPGRQAFRRHSLHIRLGLGDRHRHASDRGVGAYRGDHRRPPRKRISESMSCRSETCRSLLRGCRTCSS